MTGIISKQAAHRIWSAHREIEVGTKLLADITESLRRHEDPTPLDDFGRRKNYSLGVPVSDSAQRMLDVSPRLAAAVIEAHIAEKQRELIEATLAAKIEMEAGP